MTTQADDDAVSRDAKPDKLVKVDPKPDQPE